MEKSVFLKTQNLYAEAKLHLALPVEDIEKMKDFYVDIFQVPVHTGTTPEGKTIYALEIGCMVIAFNEVPKVIMNITNTISCSNTIEKINKTYFVRCQHWGLYNLNMNQFKEIIKRLEQNKAKFIMPPTCLNLNTSYQQYLAFFCDPQGYVIEIRASSAKRGFQSQEFEQQNSLNNKVNLME